MSNLNEYQVPESDTDITDRPEQEIVVELGNLNENQKSFLILTLASFIVQILYLTNIQIITGLFKPFIALSYNPVADYIVEFFRPVSPFLIALYFGFMFFFMYVILLDEAEDLLSLAELFDYSLVGAIFFAVLFAISIFSIPTLPVTPFYPNIVELLLFLEVLFISLVIALAPYGLYKYFLSDTQEINNQAQQSSDTNL